MYLFQKSFVLIICLFLTPILAQEVPRKQVSNEKTFGEKHNAIVPYIVAVAKQVKIYYFSKKIHFSRCP